MIAVREQRVKSTFELMHLDISVMSARMGDRTFTRHTNPDGKSGGFVETTPDSSSVIGQKVHIDATAVVLGPYEVPEGSAITAGVRIVAASIRIEDTVLKTTARMHYGSGESESVDLPGIRG